MLIYHSTTLHYTARELISVYQDFLVENAFPPSVLPNNLLFCSHRSYNLLQQRQQQQNRGNQERNRSQVDRNMMTQPQLGMTGYHKLEVLVFVHQIDSRLCYLFHLCAYCSIIDRQIK
jgi:hypothetical protein